VELKPKVSPHLAFTPCIAYSYISYFNTYKREQGRGTTKAWENKKEKKEGKS
jgi:hypothetical protein